jgi:hypothetical protein
MVEVHFHYYLRYNYMFRLMKIAIFRLYMNPKKVVIQDLIWAVYTGDVGDEVSTAQVYLHYYLWYSYMFRL